MTLELKISFGSGTDASNTFLVKWAVFFVFVFCFLLFPIRLHASVSTHYLHPGLSLWSSISVLPFSISSLQCWTRLLRIPLCKCKMKGDCAFSYFGSSVRNSLPLHIRKATTINTFKSVLISSASKNLISSYLPDLLCVSVCVWCGVLYIYLYLFLYIYIRICRER